MSICRFFFGRGPTADTMDALQHWGLLCNPVLKMNFFSIFPCNGAPVEWNWQRKTEVCREKPVPVPLYPPQIPHTPTRDRTQASAVRGRRLTTWTMAQPVFLCYVGMKTGIFWKHKKCRCWIYDYKGHKVKKKAYKRQQKRENTGMSSMLMGSWRIMSSMDDDAYVPVHKDLQAWFAVDPVQWEPPQPPALSKSLSDHVTQLLAHDDIEEGHWHLCLPHPLDLEIKPQEYVQRSTWDKLSSLYWWIFHLLSF
jgi:hypothetical protein